MSTKRLDVIPSKNDNNLFPENKNLKIKSYFLRAFIREKRLKYLLKKRSRGVTKPTLLWNILAKINYFLKPYDIIKYDFMHDDNKETQLLSCTISFYFE